MQCPICQHELKKTDQTYKIEELFKLWEVSAQLSNETFQEHRAQAEETTLYQCPNCDLGIFLPQIVGTPRLYQEFEAQKGDTYYLEDKWDFKMALEDICGAQSVVEIGCGNGAFLAKAQMQVSYVVGTEVNPDAVASARSKGLLVYRPEEQDMIKTKRGQFDAVFAFQVLEHVSSPVDFIHECVSWIKPGGIIGIAVPNSAGIIRHYRQNFLNLPPHHATRWSERTFSYLAKQSDLKIEHIAYEPLHDYHYDYLRHWWVDIFSQRNFLSYILNRLGAWTIYYLIKALKFLHIHQLPIRGHTLYVLMSKPTAVQG